MARTIKELSQVCEMLAERLEETQKAFETLQYDHSDLFDRAEKADEKLLKTVTQVTGLEFHRDRQSELNTEHRQSIEKLRNELSNSQAELAVCKMRIESQQKQIEQWGGWARILVPAAIAMVSSLVIGLVLLVVRKNP